MGRGPSSRAMGISMPSQLGDWMELGDEADSAGSESGKPHTKKFSTSKSGEEEDSSRAGEVERREGRTFARRPGPPHSRQRNAKASGEERAAPKPPKRRKRKGCATTRFCLFFLFYIAFAVWEADSRGVAGRPWRGPKHPLPPTPHHYMHTWALLAKGLIARGASHPGALSQQQQRYAHTTPSAVD